MQERSSSRARTGHRRAVALLAPLLALTAALAGCSATAGPDASAPPRSAVASAAPAGAASAAPVPRPRHVVIVVLENHTYGQVASEPYLASLLRRSAVLTDSHGTTHPSEPNYLALWSGSTQGVTDDSCPHTHRSASLGSQVLRAGMTVAGYFESMPSAGYLGCRVGPYARKHNPLADFPATADAQHLLPMTAFPADPDALPQVALVVPDLDHDMHDGSVATGDAWLRRHIGPYERWARTHDSLLVVTWDENDRSPGNHILTLFAGQHVRPGRYGQRVSHVNVLHTVEGVLGLPPLGPAARPVTGIWR